MAMNLDGIDVFVEVVDAQSFARAAQRLSMPTTTVSAKVARLEARLGVTLIQRTTRRLHVTAAGRNYYAHCVRALAALSQGEHELAASNDAPSGLLRITAPADLANSILTPLVERYLARYPKTSVELVITNHKVDLIAERIDLAVRVGPLDDSSLIVRKFVSGRIGVWASRAYLEHRGTPKTLADLKSHDIIRFSRVPWPHVLRSTAGKKVVIDGISRLSCDDLDSLKTFILRGNGIGLLPEFTNPDSGSASELVRVLPAYATENSTVYFAYPAQRYVPPTIRAFIAMATGDVA